MYKVKYGGKRGKSVELIESPDMVAIRTKNNIELENAPVSRASREMLSDTVEVAAFPEAGISVRRVAVKNPEEAITMRDEARAQLKEEDSIRFAGRVLQDAESGKVTLYTENFFIKFKDSATESQCVELLEKYDLQIKNKLPFAPNSYFVSAREGTGLQVFDMATTILKEKIVEYCHPELVQERKFKVIDPLQWHLATTTIGGNLVDAHCNIQAAWKYTMGKGITIAIIDDGFDIEHPEFAGRIVHPYDAATNTSDPRPRLKEDNHGTPCAGMACAAGLKGGASGTAPQANLMPIRLSSGLGSMAESMAFAWAADKGADVISCSWGPPDGKWWDPEDVQHKHVTVLPDSTRLALNYALQKGRKGKGCVVVFAAGNGNEDTQNDGYCSNPSVIAVAACNDRGTRSVYSDYGKSVWLCFPSNDHAWRPFRQPTPLTTGLRTTDRLRSEGLSPDNYTNNFGGTSGACPGVAGIVALMLAVNPAMTTAQVKTVLSKSCTKIDEQLGEYDEKGHSIWYGYGRLDAGLAVENAKKFKAPALRRRRHTEAVPPADTPPSKPGTSGTKTVGTKTFPVTQPARVSSVPSSRHLSCLPALSDVA